MKEFNLFEKEVEEFFPFRVANYLGSETEGVLWSWWGHFKITHAPPKLKWEILPEYYIVSKENEHIMAIKVRFTRKIIKKERSVDVWVHEDDILDSIFDKYEIRYFRCTK